MPGPADVERRFALEGERLRREASDRATSPERLTELAQIVLHGVREVVASNPSTPCTVLLELVSEFPGESCQNPAFLPCEHGDRQTRRVLAQRPLSAWLARALLAKADGMEREWLCNNETLPLWAARDVLRALMPSAPEPADDSLITVEARREWLRQHGGDRWDDDVPF